jgi:hypothetical protein
LWGGGSGATRSERVRAGARRYELKQGVARSFAAWRYMLVDLLLASLSSSMVVRA